MNNKSVRSPMTAKDIFMLAMEQTSQSGRNRLIEEACLDNSELRRKVEALLAAHDEPESLLDYPAMQTGVLETKDVERPRPLLPSPGTRIGAYKLLEQIGEGGMGIVYMAEQQEGIHRKVALKIIRPGMDTKQVIARFEAERQALAMMDHPNIARVFEVGATESGRPYFVMELVRGVPITDYCDRNRLTAIDRLNLFTAVCRAVQHAHMKGVIHRDIKPSNVLVTLHDGTPVPKIIDFGIAKATNQRLTEKTLFTAFTQMVGTPLYMSPEQAEMSGLDVDTRSDIYSLGVLLYELLTGTTPFDQTELKHAAFDEVRRIIREEEPAKPSTRLSTLDEKLTVSTARSTAPNKLTEFLRGEVDWIVMKSLSKDRTQRYETVNDMRLDVERFLQGEPISAAAPSPLYVLKKLGQKYKRQAHTAMAFLSIMLLATVLSSVFALREASARQRADEATQDAVDERAAAVTARDQANETAEEARRNLYAADILAIGKYVDEGNLGAARSLLAKHEPNAGQSDLRGWEWRYLRDRAKGDHHTKLGPHRSIVKEVAFSRDARLVAGYSNAGEVVLWDWKNKRKLHEWKLETDACSVAFDPRRDRLYVSFYVEGREWNNYPLLKLVAFDTNTYQQVSQLDEEILHFRLSPTDDAIYVRTKESIAKWFLSEDRVESVPNTAAYGLVSVSRQGKMLYVNESHSRLFVSGDGEEAHEIALPQGVNRFGRCVFLPDNSGIVASLDLQHAPQTYVFDKRTWLKTFPEECNGIHQIIVAPDGKSLITGSYDLDVSIWSLPGYERLRKMHGHDDEVFSIALSGDGRLIASGSQDESILIWNNELPPKPESIEGNFAPFDPVYADDNSWVAVTILATTKSIKSTTTVFDTATKEELRSLTGFAMPNQMTSSILATASAELNSNRNIVAMGTIHLWDTKTWELIKSIDGRRDGSSVGFKFDGANLALAYENGEVDVHETVGGDTKTHQMGLRRNSTFPFYAMDLDSRNGILLVAGVAIEGGSRRISVCDLTSGEIRNVEVPHSRDISAAKLTRDGRWAVTSSLDGRVCIFDLKSMELRHTLAAHRRGIIDISISPDSKTIATAGADRESKLIHVETGRELTTIFPGFPPFNATFSPDGEILTLSSFRSYNAPPGKWQMETLRIFRAPVTE